MTPARPASLVTSEALHAGFLSLLYQIVYHLARFPLAHPLVVIASAGAAANAIRIASE
ncbi:hypothetical protein KZZ20_06640 [Methylacidiphilum fumariolicum]|uniref:hypothetical protein n=1 Tax=Candidatus Methylacidiphilum fumarolicum TaxID=591154 RepID=UPI001D58A912|nr:hypothetical protein [Candidatus Methylacidiphilum fumarolicum]MBW6415190.1 hypothetical protein [Candidatus Methylacidiphilum fumarolicum]